MTGVLFEEDGSHGYTAKFMPQIVIETPTAAKKEKEVDSCLLTY